MIIYHGSDHIIERPQHGLGHRFNDYGMGFYCTESQGLAMEWAVGPGRDGYANCYEFDTAGLKLLDLNGPEYCTLHWLALLLANRSFPLDLPLARAAADYVLEHFSIDTSPYDWIKGYRADDSYFDFAEGFISGSLSYQQLQQAMHLGRLGQQVMLKSPDAFGQITFIESVEARSDTWYPKRRARDQKARKDFVKLAKAAPRHGLYVLDVLREELGAEDARLR